MAQWSMLTHGSAEVAPDFFGEGWGICSYAPRIPDVDGHHAQEIAELPSGYSAPTRR